MATTLPWRMKPPERVRRIEIKARSKDRAFCLGVRRSRGARRFDLDGHLKERRSICCPRGDESDSCDESGFPEHQGRPTNGRSSSVTLATSVQTLLDRMKRRKFSMPPSLSWRGRRLNLQSVPAIRICTAGLS
jgi:hypothetical protein